MSRTLHWTLTLLLLTALLLQGGVAVAGHACGGSGNVAQTAASDDHHVTPHDAHAHHPAQHAGDAVTALSPAAGCDCGYGCASHCGASGTMVMALDAAGSDWLGHGVFAPTVLTLAHAGQVPALLLRPPILL